MASQLKPQRRVPPEYPLISHFVSSLPLSLDVYPWDIIPFSFVERTFFKKWSRLHVNYISVFKMFFKKEMFQSIGPPLLSWTYWWVSCAGKKKKIIHWLFILFRLCQFSTRQGKCRPATVAKTSPTTQDGGFRVGKKYELWSQGQGEQDGELTLQAATCFNANFLQSKTWKIHFFDLLSIHMINSQSS